MYSSNFSTRHFVLQTNSTLKTETQKPDPVKIYFDPQTPSSKKRFNRKNNPSAEKKKSKLNISLNQSNQSVKSKPQKNSEKFSKEDIVNPFSPSYVKIGSLLDSKAEKEGFQNNNKARIKSRTFTQKMSKQNSLFEIEKSSKISQERENSRRSRDSRFSENSWKMAPNIKSNLAILETQLELKNNQILKLEDERRKFRNLYEDTKRKQTQLKKQFEKYKKDCLEEKRSQELKICKFQQQVRKQKKLTQQAKNQKVKMGQELKMCQREKQNVVKQLNLFYQRKVPKDVRELQSWRQMSLIQQIEELKKEINQSKSQIELDMQQIIKNLQKENNDLKEELRSTQITKRLFSKKAEDSSKYLEAYNTMKAQYQAARATTKQLKEEVEVLRRQNVKIKRELGRGNWKGQRKRSVVNMRVASDSQSLSLSVYSKD